MSSVKISALPVATVLASSDILPVVSGGATKSVTLALLQAAPFGPFTSLTDTLALTDATPTVFPLAQFPCPDLATIEVIASVVAKKVASADAFIQNYRARYYRNGGALTLIGSVIVGSDPVATGALATMTATLVLSGNTVQVRLTGVAATSVHATVGLAVQQAQ